MKDSFVFYASFYDALQGLSDEQKGQCFSAICNYAINGVEPDLSNPLVRMFFTLVKPQIDANNQRYENGCKGAEYGKLGGRPRKNNPEITPTETPKKPLENPKETPNVNDNDNVNVIKENKPKGLQKKPEISFGELNNVRLTSEQYEELKTKHSNLDIAIEKLDTWLGTSGSKNKNKNHYAYFKSNSWVWDNLDGSNSSPPTLFQSVSKQNTFVSTTREDERQQTYSLAEATKKMLEEQMKKKFGV